MMQETYFYSHIEGEVKDVIERVVIGKLTPCLDEEYIRIGNTRIPISKLAFMQKIPKSFVEAAFGEMEEIIKECKEQHIDDKKCMSKLKKFAKKAFEFPKEPSYVIISESEKFGKTIDIFFMQGLE